MHRITFIAVVFATALTGCSRHGIHGDGVIKTEDRAIPDFSKIVVKGGYEILWSSGKAALTISADQNIIPLVKTVVSGDTLHIDSMEEMTPTKGIIITLTSTSLTDVKLAGGITLKARLISSHDLKLASAGAAELDLDGTVANFEANLSGASKLNARSLHTQTAALSLIGACEADVSVTDTLKVSITGAGSCTYSGNPKSVEKNILGAGSVRPQP